MRSEGNNDEARALLSLEGLSCGDGFGECFFLHPAAREWKERRMLPPGRWPVTDDTMMAISVVAMLRRHGEIEESRLAEHFAARYDPLRGYGPAMHRLLLRVGARGGSTWKEAAESLFEGRGSFGNGSAMRVAPLGAYFAEDLPRLVEQAERSAVTTHAHPEAAAGAIAVALGAALLWRSRERELDGQALLEEVCAWTPESAVRAGLLKAMALPEATSSRDAGAWLGNGSLVTAMDTVPFTLWSAARFGDSYEEALWQTASAGGDVDTTCAMVGGMVVMRVGGVPEEWRLRREDLGPLMG